MSCAMSEMSRYPGFWLRAILNKSDTLHAHLATESCFGFKEDGRVAATLEAASPRDARSGTVVTRFLVLLAVPSAGARRAFDQLVAEV